MAIAVPFPNTLPPGYRWFDDEPPFDSGRHLALEPPAEVRSLTELGYRDDELAGLPTTAGVSAPFRILSDEGAGVMLEVARRLRPYGGDAAGRIEHATRAGCHRSRWLRDRCLSPDVTAAMAEIYGVAVAPRPMVSHLGHLNYEPTEIDTEVDKWHHDTLPLDYVMMVTDPDTIEGGRFEYFAGAKAEAAALAAEGRTPPPERRVTPTFPGPGWAVALHGNMVVHRGAPLQAQGERITMVNGSVATDCSLPAQSRTRDLIGVDDETFLYRDWARYAAWRSRGRLDRLIAELRPTADRAAVIAELRAAVEDVEQAIAEMEAGPKPADHYERRPQ